MKIMDGHFTDDTWWTSASSEAVFHHYDLLEALGGKDSSCLEINQNGKVWQDFVLNSLPPKCCSKEPFFTTVLTHCGQQILCMGFGGVVCTTVEIHCS